MYTVFRDQATTQTIELITNIADCIGSVCPYLESSCNELILKLMLVIN